MAAGSGLFVPVPWRACSLASLDSSSSESTSADLARHRQVWALVVLVWFIRSQNLAWQLAASCGFCGHRVVAYLHKGKESNCSVQLPQLTASTLAAASTTTPTSMALVVTPSAAAYTRKARTGYNKSCVTCPCLLHLLPPEFLPRPSGLRKPLLMPTRNSTDQVLGQTNPDLNKGCQQMPAPRVGKRNWTLGLCAPVVLSQFSLSLSNKHGNSVAMPITTIR